MFIFLTINNNRLFHKAVVEQGHGINIPNYIEKLLCHDSFDYFVSSKPLELDKLEQWFKNVPNLKIEFMFSRKTKSG